KCLCPVCPACITEGAALYFHHRPRGKRHSFMKEFAIDVTPEASAAVAVAPLALREKLAAFVELTKPRITFLIVLTSAAGFCLGSKGRFDYFALFNSLFGIALLSSGIAALN